jgi:hypothetical protein
MKRIFIFTLFLVFALVPPLSVFASTETELLRDTKFANGFGACFWLGQTYLPGPDVLKKGICQSYQSSPGYHISVIPDDDPKKTIADNNADKYWELNDGIHKGYTDDTGTYVTELFTHHVNINRNVIVNSPANLLFEQHNPKTNALVKQVSTNRQGKIYLYYNSKNEIRNAANKYASEFANDTWPTFQLNQNFREYIDLSKYDQISVSLEPKIISWTVIPGWPFSGKAGYSEPEMSLNLYTFVRERDYPLRGIFVGMALYSSNPEVQYKAYNGVDQLGQGFFRDDVRLYGGPAKPANYTTIQFDLLKLIDKALAKTGKTHADYVLSSFDLGYEGMGWFEGSFDVQNLSMIGISSKNALPLPTPTGKLIPSVSPHVLATHDLNLDGRVDIFDYNILVSTFGMTGSVAGDIDKNGKVDIFDYNLLIADFGK